MFVGLLFIGHTTFVHFAALPPSTLRAAKPAVAGGPARAAGKHAHSESTRAHAVQLLNVKIAALMHDAFQKRNRTRAHAVVYATAEIFKKKTNMPLPKFSLQFAFSWSVYFSNRTESYSSQIEFAGPHGITENQATYLHCGGEARAKKRARPPAGDMQKGEQGKDGSSHRPGGMWNACGLPKPVPRSTKTTIMTVHVNPIMQAAPSQRRIISIIEASNQLLFHSQKLFFVE